MWLGCLAMLPTSLWTRKQFEASALNQAWIHVSMSMATACVTSQRYPEPSRAGLASPMILLPWITLGSAHLLDRKPAFHSVGSWVSCLSVLRPSSIYRETWLESRRLSKRATFFFSLTTSYPYLLIQTPPILPGQLASPSVLSDRILCPTLGGVSKEESRREREAWLPGVMQSA